MANDTPEIREVYKQGILDLFTAAKLEGQDLAEIASRIATRMSMASAAGDLPSIEEMEKQIGSYLETKGYVLASESNSMIATCAVTILKTVGAAATAA